MTDDRNMRDSGNDGEDGGSRDYLGRILIAFVAAAAFFWILTFIF